jgi:hypothetical protein
MSTLKSSSTDLTLNADGVGNDIIFQSNAGQVGSLTAEGVLTATSYAGSGAASLAWGGTILWPSGTAPSPSGKTIYSFISNGTNWYGMMAGTGFA